VAHRQEAVHGGAAAQPQTVPVVFRLKRKVKYGQWHVVVGDHPALGGWKLKRAPQMGWSEGNVWQAEVSLPTGTSLEFKVGVWW
jgi:hypothetical protein